MDLDVSKGENLVVRHEWGLWLLSQWHWSVSFQLNDIYTLFFYFSGWRRLGNSLGLCILISLRMASLCIPNYDYIMGITRIVSVWGIYWPPEPFTQWSRITQGSREPPLCILLPFISIRIMSKCDAGPISAQPWLLFQSLLDSRAHVYRHESCFGLSPYTIPNATWSWKTELQRSYCRWTLFFPSIQWLLQEGVFPVSTYANVLAMNHVNTVIDQIYTWRHSYINWLLFTWKWGGWFFLETPSGIDCLLSMMEIPR